MMYSEKKNPGGNRGLCNECKRNSIRMKGRGQGFFDRALLPSPHAYLQSIGARFTTTSNTAKVRCIFHEEKNASLLVNLTDGHFKCLACGAKGRDILAFHQLLRGLSFKEAAQDLGAWVFRGAP